MNWYEIWTHVVAELEVDAEVGAVLGDRFFLAGERAVEVPSMTALLVVNTETEVWAPAEWQFDGYFESFDDMIRWEKAMMRLFNQPLAVQLGDVTVTAEFIAGQLLRGPERDPYYRRQLEFRFTPVRSRYYRPSPVGG